MTTILPCLSQVMLSPVLQSGGQSNYPITHLFTKNESEFKGAVWIGGVVKVVERGRLVKPHDSYFARNKNI